MMMSHNSKKILLVEDQVLVQGALATLLNLEDHIDIVKTANNAADALMILKQNSVDILITDIEMPGISGLDLCQIVKSKYPNIKRIIVTTFCRSGYIKRAVDDNIDGFILKNSPVEELINCVKDVSLGKRVFSSQLLLKAMDTVDVLNANERKALQLVKQGKSNKEIADILFLSHGTIKNYISSCIAKLGASNRVEAIRMADKNGLL